ncbi:MAG: flavodoxin family protein [Rickettsiales bacterium]|jgi:multimeric flavodoxin WrbA|nr:flavodoxin family protein [Rickettsiales bacterium]
MKVVAINGSPNKNGNTATMLNEILKVVKSSGGETKFIQIGGQNIHGCRACGQCRSLKNKTCAFADDIFNSVFAEIVDADAIILGTPSYFSAMSPETKAFIDRMGYVSLANNRLLKHKIGAGVVAERRAGGSAIQASLHYVFLMNEMLIPGSTYWNIGIGDVNNDNEAMDNMKNLGENIVWLIKKIV